MLIPLNVAAIGQEFPFPLKQKLPFLQDLRQLGSVLKNTASMTQFPSTAILHHTSNKANTQLGLLEGMYALHSVQKWLRTQQPRPNQQRQPSTSSVIAPPKTMWSTELSDEEDKPPSKDQPGITNDFLPLLLDADNDDDNNGYTPQPC